MIYYKEYDLIGKDLKAITNEENDKNEDKSKYMLTTYSNNNWILVIILNLHFSWRNSRSLAHLHFKTLFFNKDLATNNS